VSPDGNHPPSPGYASDGQSRIGRVAVIVVIVALMTMWAWIWFFAPRENVDRFAQRAFPEAANPICAAAHEEILALPSGRQTPDVAERAAVVRRGTEIVETMVADLEAIAYLVTDLDDAAILRQWFADWHDLYLADRWTHVERLEAATAETPDEDLAFLVQDLQYGRRIDGLANVNDMEACVIPGDI